MRRFNLFILLLLCAAGCSPAKEQGATLLIGTYTDSGSRGIYRTTFSEVGFTAPELVVEVDNPSFLALSDDRSTLYAVSEGGTDDTSALNAYRYDAAADSFTLINRQPTFGASPCYVRLFGGRAFTANYTGGSFTLFPIAEDGSLGEPQEREFEPREGSRSHVHGLFEAPDGESMYVTDLGRNEIFQIDGEGRELSRTQLRMGAGPRHMAFSKDGKVAYALNEYEGTVYVFDIEPQGLSLKQEIASDSVGGRGSADIHLSADGRFLYASNCLKEDGISVFSVGEDGRLTKVGYTLTGVHPRNFTLTADDRYLLVAVRDSNRVEVYARDAKTGLLTPTAMSLDLSHPVCLVWM